MRSWIFWGVVAFAAVVGRAAFGTSQPKADEYIVGIDVAGQQSSMSLLAITQAGAARTLFNVPFLVPLIRMAENNVDLVTMPFAPGRGDLIRISPAGVVTTIAAIANLLPDVGFLVDQDGSYVVPLNRPGIPLLKINGGTRTTLVPTPPLSAGSFIGLAADPGTGDYLVVRSPTIWSVDRRTGASAAIFSGLNPAPFTGYRHDLSPNMRRGTLVLNEPSRLREFDPRSRQITTFAASIPTLFGADYDRGSDAWVATAGGVFPWRSYLLRYARSGASTTLTGPLPYQVSGAMVYGSRHVVASSHPVPGARFNLTFSEPGSPGDAYVAAASFATSPGIRIQGKMIDLSPFDPLFTLSQSSPAIFVGFQGRLDTAGTANAWINVPNVPSLSRVSFYVTFVTVSGSTIRVANTSRFTFL